MVFLYAFIAIAVLGLAISGKLRVLVKGFINLFVEDLAKTPEGAAAVYTEAIDQAQNRYNEANNTFRQVAGQLETAKRRHETLKGKVVEIEKKCEFLAQANKFEELELIAGQREEFLAEVTVLEKQIIKLTEAYNDAKELNSHFEKELVRLKADKKKIVSELKMNKQMEEMYDNMDKLKNTKSTDKLLAAIKDKIEDGRETVAGAKAVHDNKLETRLDRADQTAKKLATNSYVESLKQKYTNEN